MREISPYAENLDRFAAGIGVTMGLCAFIVDLALEILNSWKFNTVKTVIRNAGGFWPPYIAFLFFTMGFSALSGSIVSFIAPMAAGSGIPEVKSYLNGVHIKGASPPHQQLNGLFVASMIAKPEPLALVNPSAVSLTDRLG